VVVVALVAAAADADMWTVLVLVVAGPAIAGAVIAVAGRATQCAAQYRHRLATTTGKWWRCR